MDKLGPEHVNVAASYHILASTYQALCDLEQASISKEYKQRALEMQLENLGPELVNVAGSYHNFASIFHTLGDLELGKEYQQCAAMLLEKLLWMRRSMIWKIMTFSWHIWHLDARENDLSCLQKKILVFLLICGFLGCLFSFLTLMPFPC